MLPIVRIALLGVLIAGAAVAETRISVLPFKGPRAAAVRKQVTGALCGDVATCVAPAKVTTRGRPDYAKARRAGVEWLVTATLSGKGARRVLTVDAFNARGKRVWRERLKLARNGTLSRGALKTLVERVEAAAPSEPQAPDPAQAATPEPEPEPEQAAEATGSAEGSSPTETAEAPEAAQATADPELNAPALIQEEPAPAATDTQAKRGPILVVELGGDVIHRRLDYVDLAAQNLRTYVTEPFLFAPRLHAEVYPLAPFVSGVAQGLGLEVGYLMAVGLRSIDEEDREYATTMNQLDVGVRFNLRPAGDLDLTVAPIVGYRSATFAVGAAADGRELFGLPDFNYGGLRVGLEAEMGFGQVVTFGRFEYLHLLSLGEIGAEPYFPDSSGSALAVALGAGYRVTDSLQVRLTGHFTRYGLTFRPAEGAEYVASGAVDQRIGGMLSLRYSF